MAREKKFLQFGIKQSLYQGSGSINAIPQILETEGWKRVMIVADPDLYRFGVIKPIEDVIREAVGEENYFVFTDLVPNPEAKTIDEKANPAYREFGADVMVAVGGGSTMDTAKGVAISGDSGKSCVDPAFLFGIDPHKPFEHKTFPIIAVPTTAGTGSDVCRNAVICNYQGEKIVPSHDCILPAYSIMDPDLLAGLPRSVAAATAMDALTHGIESYVSMSANDFTELFSLRSLELIGPAIRPFCANPAEDKWADMMSLGCMYSGFSLGIASIGQDHVITHPMSEEPFHMPHGDACGMVLPAVIEWNAEGCMEKYRKAYNALAQKNVSVEDFDIQMLIDWVIDLNVDLNIAQNKTFEEWGYNSDDVLDLMMRHPIFNGKDATPNNRCNYPRVTRAKDFRYLIERTNQYSKVQKARAEAKKNIDK